MNRRFALTGAGLLLAAVTLGLGKDRVDPVNKDGKALALKGYDMVAYFDAGKPTKGRAEFTHEALGAMWRFASAANRDKFAADPARYVPQFGGYCAWAVGHGYTAPVDPEAWEIVDRKLYLNYNRDVRAMWLKDAKNWIQQGNRNWPSLHR